MRWTVPLLALAIVPLLVAGIHNADAVDGDLPPYVEVIFYMDDSDPFNTRGLILAPGDTIPPEYIPELPEGMVAWAPTGSYTPFDFNTPIYDWTTLHPIDHLPTPPPPPEPKDPDDDKDPSIFDQKGLWAAFITLTVVLAIVASRLRH